METTLDITGMDCSDCAVTLEKGVGALQGVQGVQVDFALGKMHLKYQPEAVTLDQIVTTIRKIGYDVAETRPGPQPFPEQRGVQALAHFFLADRRARLALIAALAFIAGAGLSLLPGAAPLSRVAYLLTVLIGGLYPARAGWAALRSGRGLDMNVLMSLAVIGALAIDEWAEAAAVIALFALGEALEAFTLARARAGIRALMALSPAEAVRLEDGYERRVPADQLQPGDRIRIAPGERLPADGIVLAGHSAVDQSPITGESLPVEVGPGAALYAGCINGRGSLEVRVTKRASESTLARIIALVEEAQSQRGRAQQFVDRFARIYTPAVVAGAALLALIPPALFRGDPAAWLYRALVLLVIACPCALVISTPVSIVAAIARAARLGILIKGGASLEAAASLNAVAFDKTGTLTRGQPHVVHTVVFDRDGGALTEENLLALAAALEQPSEHPLAQALLHEARHRGLALPPVNEFTALPGRGARARLNGRVYHIGHRDLFARRFALSAEMQAQVEAHERHGESVLLVGDESGPLGLIAIADAPRPESAAAIQALHRLGLTRTILLTGDNATTAAAIAQAVGIDEVRADLMPEDKVRAIEALVARHGAVGMVGDGINDAPALARATVGIAMGVAGTDVALETADIALMRDDLRQVATTIALSRATQQVIRQNLAFSLIVKALFVALALAGAATLWMAVFADMGASLLVTFNGMRLLRHPGQVGG